MDGGAAADAGPSGLDADPGSDADPGRTPDSAVALDAAVCSVEECALRLGVPPVPDHPCGHCWAECRTDTAGCDGKFPSAAEHGLR